MMDECNHNDDLTSVSYEVLTSNGSKGNGSFGVRVKQEVNEKHYNVVSYGPIKVRVSTRSTPTLLSGRRSKFYPLEGEEATKRELKREKNRRTARMLKERHIQIELGLMNELSALQTKEKTLLEEINNLESYKGFLKDRFHEQEFERKGKLSRERTKQTEVTVSPKSDSIPIKTEQSPASPRWELLFSI